MAMHYVHEARLGDEYTRKGCLWRAVAIEPYTRKDGSETQLAVWRGVCVVCGGAKLVKTPMNLWLDGSSSFDLRRCPNCVKARRKLPEQRKPQKLGVWQRRVLEAVEDLKLTAESATTEDVVHAAVRHAPAPREGARDMRRFHARRALELLMRRPGVGLSDADGGISWA